MQRAGGRQGEGDASRTFLSYLGSHQYLKREEISEEDIYRVMNYIIIVLQIKFIKQMQAGIVSVVATTDLETFIGESCFARKSKR